VSGTKLTPTGLASTVHLSLHLLQLAADFNFVIHGHPDFSKS
jgi:hypothetical protein